MRVRVLVSGVYNGPEHREPVKAEPGDVIEVASGWYAAELMAQGLVTADVAIPGEAPKGEATESQAAAGPTQKKPAEPKGKRLSELRRLSDARE
jgi:glycine cleavage system aminomethyltransferase T